MKSKILIITLIVFLILPMNSSAYPIVVDYPLVDKSQAIACMKDRNASDEFLEMIPFIYEYATEVGTDPSLTVAMSALETGYGKSNLFIRNNNPGGIKAKKGWVKFNTLEDGYRYMIDLLATYAGLKNPSSWLHGYSKTTEGLAGMYWTNYGTDRGYHRQIEKMINTMKTYPKEKPKKSNKTKKESNKIYEILNRNERSKGYNKIMSYIRRN